MTMVDAPAAHAPARDDLASRMWAAPFAATHDHAVIAVALILGASAPAF